MDDAKKVAYNICSDAIIEEQMKAMGILPPVLPPMTASPEVWDQVVLLMGPHLDSFPALQADRRLAPLHVGHQVAIAQELADVAPLFIALGGAPGIGKTFHFEGAAERELREESSIWREEPGARKLTINYLGFDEYYPGVDYRKYQLLDEDKGAPEWQKRRNRSASAKQELIDKLKAKRRAR